MTASGGRGAAVVSFGTGAFVKATELLYTIPVIGTRACETPNMYCIGGYTEGTVQLNSLPVVDPMRTGNETPELLM